MAVNSGFFNAQIVNGQYDRTYLAEDFATCMTGLVRNGVIVKSTDNTPQLKVTKGSAGTMQLHVSKGRAWINGYWFENTADLILEAPAFDLSQRRMDAVVLRLDYTQRKISIYIKQGTPGSQPSVPIQRDSEAYELFLAVYDSDPTDVDITDVVIIDERGFSDVCGYCTMAINGVDGKNQIIDIDYSGYSGLPEDEKLNGTAYFITDKNYIMRNGIKYGSEIIPERITASEYEDLEEKDPNTLYVVIADQE